MQEQKKTHACISVELLAESEEDPNYLNTIITGDESWICANDEATKVQSSQWIYKGELRPKKAKTARNSNLNVLLILFFDHEEVVHHKYIFQDKTVSSDDYLEVLQFLRDTVRQKQPHYWQSDSN